MNELLNAPSRFAAAPADERPSTRRPGAENGNADSSRFADLPPPDTKRWVMRRKAAVVAAVRNGVLSVDEACRMYNISIEEFVSWQTLIENYGIPGLRATRIQLYRDKGSK